MSAAYLKGRPTIADQARQNIDGQNAANQALFDISHAFPDPDMLHERLKTVVAAGEPERLRAFCRTLQKRLEATQRTGAPAA